MALKVEYRPVESKGGMYAIPIFVERARLLLVFMNTSWVKILYGSKCCDGNFSRLDPYDEEGFSYDEEGFCSACQGPFEWQGPALYDDDGVPYTTFSLRYDREECGFVFYDEEQEMFEKFLRFFVRGEYDFILEYNKFMVELDEYVNDPFQIWNPPC